MELTNVTSDRECKEMELASIVSYSMPSAITEEPALSPLVNQWLSISQWKVSARNVNSMRLPHQVVLNVWEIQQRSFQIPRSWPQHQLLFNQLPHQSTVQLVLMSGLMSNSCQKTVQQDSIWTSRLETGVSFWEMLWECHLQLQDLELLYWLQWMLSETTDTYKFFTKKR